MKESDLEEVSNIFMESFNDVGENWTEETAQEHVKQNYFGDSHWVAKLDGKIVGGLMGIILIRESGAELFIDSVFVLPEYRNRGIGKALWEKAKSYVKENELRGIRLLGNKELKSYSWYRKMGYHPSGWVELSSENK